MDINNLKFDERGLIPVVTQDALTHEALMLAYMNKESLEKTLETGRAHYYSRSRGQLWLKGETSGCFQNVVDIYYDCDEDALLMLVEQVGAACHTGRKSCFYRSLTDDGEREPVVMTAFERLAEVVRDRKEHPVERSYTNYLFDKGIDKILKKVGEESTEVVIAAKNDVKSEIVYEVSDLIYHLTVLLTDKGVGWGDIYEELRKREH